MTTTQAYENGNGGMILIPDHTSPEQAVLAEGIATFFLIYVILHMAVEQRGDKLTPIAVGLTVIANVYAMLVKSKHCDFF